MSIRSRRVPVKNRDRAVAFYSTLLGVDLEREAHALTFEETHENVSTLLHLNVAHRLDDALAFIWSNGGRILESSTTIAGRDHCALVMDCEGNHIALHTSQGKQPARGGIIRRMFARRSA